MQDKLQSFIIGGQSNSTRHPPCTPMQCTHVPPPPIPPPTPHPPPPLPPSINVASLPIRAFIAVKGSSFNKHVGCSSTPKEHPSGMGKERGGRETTTPGRANQLKLRPANGKICSKNLGSFCILRPCENHPYGVWKVTYMTGICTGVTSGIGEQAHKKNVTHTTHIFKNWPLVLFELWACTPPTVSPGPYT